MLLSLPHSLHIRLSLTLSSFLTAHPPHSTSFSKLYNIRITAAGADALQPHPSPASQPIQIHYLQGVWRRSGESWDYLTHLPGNGNTWHTCVCVFSVCVANRNLCGFVDLVFKLLKQSLWLPERSGVIKLPLFQKLSCDCVMAPSFRLPSSSC